MKTAIITVSAGGAQTALKVQHELAGSELFSLKEISGFTCIGSCQSFLEDNFAQLENIVFIGAMGICVRSIAPFVKDKYTDPAVVCIDSAQNYVIPVLSGHIGGANELARTLARALGSQAVITTQSDAASLWPLDTLDRCLGWTLEPVDRTSMNSMIAHFVNGKSTALLLEIHDKGTDWLESNLPGHVRVFNRFDQINFEDFSLLIAVTPFLHNAPIPTLCYRPHVLHVGVGCRKQCNQAGVPQYITDCLNSNGLSELSVSSIDTIELKKDEPLIDALKTEWPQASVRIYTAGELENIEVPNPSDKAFAATGLYGVAESTAMKAAGNDSLLIEKQKGLISEGSNFTFAVALERSAQLSGHIEIVGAGPGDPELVSVRGKRMLEKADLILYAGSLVPKELTYYAKQGATVRSSADMDLEEQFELMKSFYDRGLLVVRLHTGDPCIYGAIQEQMNFFDRYGMSYHITPGISSFQAAAAALRSQFTIPEKVQSIILTRGEGRTPMPEKEQLHKLAQSNSTMCIYLSAAIVEKVQEELLMAYPPETPVAACYKLTWKEEKIYRGQLKDLARIVRDNNLTLTTLLVVGDAIDNRQGLSRLYAHEFKHLFRK